MTDAVVLLCLFAGAGMTLYLWLNARHRRIALERLIAREDLPDEHSQPAPRQQLFVRRHRIYPWVAGLLFAVALHYLAGMQTVYCGAGGIVVALLGTLVEQMIAQRNIQRIEMQLADAIDIMVGALRAGVSVSAALENALAESRWPLRPQLEQVIGRIRLGDEPQTVFKALAAQRPIGNFSTFFFRAGGALGSRGQFSPYAGDGRSYHSRSNRTFAPHPLDVGPGARLNHCSIGNHLFHRVGYVAQRPATHGRFPFHIHWK